MSDNFRPFALLVQRLREPRSYEDHKDACEQAAKVLEYLSPSAKIVLDAISAERADCCLVVGEPGKRRYLPLWEAVRGLQFTLMRGPPSKTPTR